MARSTSAVRFWTSFGPDALRRAALGLALVVGACNVYDESLLNSGSGELSAGGASGGPVLGAGGSADAAARGGAAGAGRGGAGGVSAGGSTGATGTGGAAGSAGMAASSGGGGSATGSGGAFSGTGGVRAGSGGASAGTGGATTGAGGGAGTGGSTPRDSGSSSDATVPPAPACAAGEAKGSACVTATPEGRSCYKTCGPDGVGYKLETCTSGSYVESDCAYLPNQSYSCYRLPQLPATPPACPAGTQATMPCSMSACTACGPTYLDSSGASKTGYCVCNGSTLNWTCGSTSTNSWPCSASPPNPNPGC